MIKHIEDYLITLHPGTWFKWTDSKNKIYSNLKLSDKVSVAGEVVDNPFSLPTEQECIDGVAQLQADYDALAYARARSLAYPGWQEFAEAYTEKEIGEDSTKWDAYVTAYNKVRSDNSKE